MRKFLLVTTILSVGLNPLGFAAYTHAYAQSASEDQGTELTDQQKQALLEKKLAAIQARIKDLLAKIEDPAAKAEAQEAYEAALEIRSPLHRGKALAKLRKILSVSNLETRHKLLAQYTPAVKGIASGGARHDHTSASGQGQGQGQGHSHEDGADHDTSTGNQGSDTEDFSFSEDDTPSQTTGTTTTSTGTTTTGTTPDTSSTTPSSTETAKKDVIYQRLTGQYITASCTPITTDQKGKVQAIYDFSKTAKFSSPEAMLADFEDKMTNFFKTDYVPKNCTATTQPASTGSGGGGGGGGGGGMCQLMKMLKTLIPLAAAVLAGGGSLGDAQSVGQQELAALQKNQGSTDQTAEQKAERARQMASVGQGLAMISKMMSGGGQQQQGGQQGGQNGQQQGGGCK